MCWDNGIVMAGFGGSAGSAIFLVQFLSIGSFDGSIISMIVAAAAEMVLLCGCLDCCFCPLAA